MLEDLINQEVHHSVRLLGTHIGGADVALGFGADVPYLPGRPTRLDNGQDVISRLCDPV